jgi:hypothetical protein
VFGGGIYNVGGDLTLVESTVSDNKAAGFGGGIANFLTAKLTDSTVSGNESGFSNGGGIYHFGIELTLTGSTVSGNKAANGLLGTGGGV